MYHKIFLPVLLSFLSFCISVSAQNAPSAYKQKTKDRADYNNFKQQIMHLKEYAEERKKIPKLQKENHVPIKVTATIDTSEADDDQKNILTGHITQQIGDNSSNAYDITYDRTSTKIITIKKTGDADDPEAMESKKDKEAKPVTTHPKSKKNKEDEEDDSDEEKPVKGKAKDKDDE